MIFELGSIFCVIGCLFMLLSLAFFQFFEMAAVSLLFFGGIIFIIGIICNIIDMIAEFIKEYF